MFKAIAVIATLAFITSTSCTKLIIKVKNPMGVSMDLQAQDGTRHQFLTPGTDNFSGAIFDSPFKVSAKRDTNGQIEIVGNGSNLTINGHDQNLILPSTNIFPGWISLQYRSDDMSFNDILKAHKFEKKFTYWLQHNYVGSYSEPDYVARFERTERLKEMHLSKLDSILPDPKITHEIYNDQTMTVIVSTPIENIEWIKKVPERKAAYIIGCLYLIGGACFSPGFAMKDQTSKIALLSIGSALVSYGIVTLFWGIFSQEKVIYPTAPN